MRQIYIYIYIQEIATEFNMIVVDRLMVWWIKHRVWMFLCIGYKASVNMIIETICSVDYSVNSQVWRDEFISRWIFYVRWSIHFDLLLLLYIGCGCVHVFLKSVDNKQTNILT